MPTLKTILSDKAHGLDRILSVSLWYRTDRCGDAGVWTGLACGQTAGTSCHQPKTVETKAIPDWPTSDGTGTISGENPIPGKRTRTDQSGISRLSAETG